MEKGRISEKKNSEMCWVPNFNSFVTNCIGHFTGAHFRIRVSDYACHNWRRDRSLDLATVWWPQNWTNYMNYTGAIVCNSAMLSVHCQADVHDPEFSTQPHPRTTLRDRQDGQTPGHSIHRDAIRTCTPLSSQNGTVTSASADNVPAQLITSQRLWSITI